MVLYMHASLQVDRRTLHHVGSGYGADALDADYPYLRHAGYSLQ